VDDGLGEDPVGVVVVGDAPARADGDVAGPDPLRVVSKVYLPG
jgi:hypothetical protein